MQKFLQSSRVVSSKQTKYTLRYYTMIMQSAELSYHFFHRMILGLLSPCEKEVHISIILLVTWIYMKLIYLSVSQSQCESLNETESNCSSFLSFSFFYLCINIYNVKDKLKITTFNLKIQVMTLGRSFCWFSGQWSQTWSSLTQAARWFKPYLLISVSVVTHFGIIDCFHTRKCLSQNIEFSYSK